MPVTAGTAPSRRQRRFALSGETLAALAGPALEPLRLEAADVVLAALVRGLDDGGAGVAIDLHRRPRGDHDLSRTVWSLSAPGALRFDPPAAGNLRGFLIGVKDRVRASETIEEAAASVLFADLPAPVLPAGWTARAAAPAPATAQPAGGPLRRGGRRVGDRPRRGRLADRRRGGARRAPRRGIDDLVALCLTPGVGALTRSDVPFATVGQADLDRLAAAEPPVETVHDASFGQAGMLFHALLDPEAGAFLLQTRIDFSAGLDVPVLKAAVGDLLARHPVLRTDFLWEDRALPLQVVRRAVDLPWREVDLSAEGDEAAALDRLAGADLAEPLDLARAPLMRLTLARRREGFTLVWLKHHAVVDGWSMPLLYDDLLAAYAARAGGMAPALPPAPGFERYVGWLRQFDRAAAERHWSRELAGFDTPTDLGLGRGTAAETGAIGRVERHLDAATFARLSERARAERVTLGTLVMGAWSVLLSRYAGRREVLANVTVSGRPHDLPGAEAIVGMFLNALPLRPTWTTRPTSGPGCARSRTATPPTTRSAISPSRNWSARAPCRRASASPRRW